MKFVIIGNAGSGKSYLAEQLSKHCDIPHINLDALFWEPDSYSKKRPLEVVLQDIENLTSGENWIVEGVYGELVEGILPKAEKLIWLDFKWDACKKNLIVREEERRKQGRAKDNDGSFKALLKYAKNYWKRENLRSWVGHNRLFEDFKGTKVVVFDREEVDRFCSKCLNEDNS